MSFSDIFKKKRQSSDTIYCDNFIYGYHDFFCAAFNTLNTIETSKIGGFAAQCRNLTTGSIKDIQARFFRLRHAIYGYHYGTKYAEPDFELLKKYSGSDFPALLAAGMMHESGYCREKCTSLIADYPEYLPLVIHGFNDWVHPVRIAAEKSFFSMLLKADIFTIVKTYRETDIVKKCGRCDRSSIDSARNKILEILRQKNDMEIIAEIKTIPEPDERFRLYSPLIDSRIISAETADHLITTESNTIKDRLLIAAIAKYKLPENRLIELTESKIPIIRYIAARELYERFGLWKGAEKLLLDKRTSVRGNIQYYFEKSGQINLKEFYRDNFPKPEAIKGFGECGVFSDESEIKPFVSSEDEKIAAAAVYALFRLTSDGNDDLYYDMITDSRQQVSKTAFKAMNRCGNAVPEMVYNDIISHRSDQLTAKRLVKILCRNTGSLWNAMPWFIRLYNAPEEYIYIPVRIAVSKRSYVYLSTVEHAEEIRRAMVESSLPEALAKQIYKEIGVS